VSGPHGAEVTTSPPQHRHRERRRQIEATACRYGTCLPVPTSLMARRGRLAAGVRCMAARSRVIVENDGHHAGGRDALVAASAPPAALAAPRTRVRSGDRRAPAWLPTSVPCATSVRHLMADWGGFQADWR
jgi:hypothetical protein